MQVSHYSLLLRYLFRSYNFEMYLVTLIQNCLKVFILVLKDFLMPQKMFFLNLFLKTIKVDILLAENRIPVMLKIV